MLTCCSHDACLDRGGHHDALERGHPRPIAEPTGQSTGGAVALGVVQHHYELTARKPKEMNRQDSAAIELSAFPSPGRSADPTPSSSPWPPPVWVPATVNAWQSSGATPGAVWPDRQGVRRVHQARLWAVSAPPVRRQATRTAAAVQIAALGCLGTPRSTGDNAVPVMWPCGRGAWTSFAGSLGRARAAQCTGRFQAESRGE